MKGLILISQRAKLTVVSFNCILHLASVTTIRLTSEIGSSNNFLALSIYWQFFGIVNLVTFFSIGTFVVYFGQSLVIFLHHPSVTVGHLIKFFPTANQKEEKD